MTFSICVRESYEAGGQEHRQFGVAVTTRLPAVGTLCPFVGERGAIATQGLVNVDLGRNGIRYLSDGLGIEDALQALLNADGNASARQLHGVDVDGSFTYSGDDCKDWFGHVEGENYTVAGNLLTGEDVISKTARAYEDADTDRPLADRLVDALAAGQAVGGDKREDLHVQSAAINVETTENAEITPYYNDLRVDASETPIEELRATYELAEEGYEAVLERYGEDDE